jgi:hypothetical protein
MHRQTARLLLIFLLVGVFTPLALAISAPAPHACCMRKPMHDAGSHDLQFNAPPSCCQHDCCRVVVTSSWARPASFETSVFIAGFSKLLPKLTAPYAGSTDGNSHYGRSPPLISPS